MTGAAGLCTSYKHMGDLDSRLVLQEGAQRAEMRGGNSSHQFYFYKVRHDAVVFMYVH